MIFIILTIGLLIRLVSINQSLWLDEAINVTAAQKFSFLGMIIQYAPADFHPPGWFIILWLWGKLFGYSEIAVRIPSVIFGVVTIYVTYLIGKKLVSKNVGLISSALLSINPLHVYYSQEARMYSLAAMAVSINMLCLIKLLKREKLSLILIILSNIAVLSADYLAYFIFPAEAILLLIAARKELIKKWVIALIAAIILGIWWLPVFLSQFNVGLIASSNLPTWKFVVGAFDFKTLPLTFIKFVIGRISLADKVIYALILLPVCTLFLYLLWRGFRQADNLAKRLLSLWVIIPLIIATTLSILVPIYSYFRVLFIIPAFVILVSLGILSFNRQLKFFFIILIFFIELFSVSIYLLNPVYQREDWRGLVNYFSNRNSIILFESSGSLPPFDYYAKNDLQARGALKDFPAKEENDVIDLENLLKNDKEAYLVDYLVEISDPMRLVTKELGKLGYQQREILNFNGVGFVYHYVKNN